MGESMTKGTKLLAAMAIAAAICVPSGAVAYAAAGSDGQPVTEAASSATPATTVEPETTVAPETTDPSSRSDSLRTSEDDASPATTEAATSTADDRGLVAQSADVLATQHISDLADGEYYIAPAGSSDNLVATQGGITSSSTSLVLRVAGGGVAQTWVVSHDGNGYVTLTCKASGLVLDVRGGTASDGRALQLYAGNDTAAQKWVAVRQDDGSYELVSALDPTKVMDLASGRTSAGTQVQLYSSNDTPAQRFSLLKVSDVRSSLDEKAAANEGVIADGTYVISSTARSTGVLDVADGSTQNAANVQLFSSNMTKAQRWVVSHDEKGYVILTSEKSGRVLDASGGSAFPGTNVQQYDSNGSIAQRWIVTRDSRGAYRISSALWDSRSLDLAAGRTADGSNVQVYSDNATTAQSFSFVSTTPEVAPCEDILGSGWYSIGLSSDTSKVLDVAGGGTGNSTNVQTYSSNDTFAQMWRFTYEDGYYRIESAGSGRVLDVDSGNLVAGTNVQIWDSTASDDNQLFSVTKNTDGSYTFINKANGLALDVSGGSKSNGANIDCWTPNGTAAQSFTLAERKNLLAEGLYNVVSALRGNAVLDVSAGSTSDGANVQIWSSNSTGSQKWKVCEVSGKENTYRLEVVSSGGYLTADSSGNVCQRFADTSSQWWVPSIKAGCVTFENVATGKVLDVSGGQSSDGTNVQVWKANVSSSQSFSLVSTEALANGTYFVNLASDTGRVLDVDGGSRTSGANVQVWQNNDTGGQKWKIERGSDGLYTLTNCKSNKVLDLAGGSTTPGTNVRQWDANGSTAQKWRIEYVSGGNFKISSALNRSIVLDVSGGVAANGRNIQVYGDNSSAAQRFRFTATTYTPDYYHHINTVGQPNNYYCGPTSGYMILASVNAWSSADGTGLSIYNVASYMHTDAYGYTSFNDRRFARGMNAWLGSDVYYTIHTPSVSQVRDSVIHSYDTGYATAVDERERRGGPHFNGHSNSTFSHIMVVDGYDPSTDSIYIADPGISLWSGASGHFWYGLSDFTQTYLQTEIMGDGREHIGIYTS
jgi:5-hydroxyisourate hydrolase-like protein (transthyretin family)